MDGKTALGASSPAKPALQSPEPLSHTRAVLSSSSHIAGAASQGSTETGRKQPPLYQESRAHHHPQPQTGFLELLGCFRWRLSPNLNYHTLYLEMLSLDCKAFDELEL